MPFNITNEHREIERGELKGGESFQAQGLAYEMNILQAVFRHYATEVQGV